MLQEITFFFLYKVYACVIADVLLTMKERSDEIEENCIKCGRNIALHPSTGRLHSIILHGRECAWNPDEEFKDFVINTLKSSGYNLKDFGYTEISTS